jgi:hypothetical protein
MTSTSLQCQSIEWDKPPQIVKSKQEGVDPFHQKIPGKTNERAKSADCHFGIHLRPNTANEEQSTDIAHEKHQQIQHFLRQECQPISAVRKSALNGDDPTVPASPLLEKAIDSIERKLARQEEQRADPDAA